MELSYTFAGGLGDYILNYLDVPGNRLKSILASDPDIKLTIRTSYNWAGLDLFKNNDLFRDSIFFEEIPYLTNRLENDIANIVDIECFSKFTPSLWLGEWEEEALYEIKKPYAVFHPWASANLRSLDQVFNIQLMAQLISDVSGLNVIVLGEENLNYGSESVMQIKCSSRLSVKIIEGATFFVGSHSSMQCAAWVHKIPSFCIGPEVLLFHNLYSPGSFKRFLKPLFAKNNVFMLFKEANRFPDFFDYFLKQGTSLEPWLTREEYPGKLTLSNMASGSSRFSGMYNR